MIGWDSDRRRSGSWDPMINNRGSWDSDRRRSGSWDPLTNNQDISYESDRRDSRNGYDRYGYGRSGWGRYGVATIAEDLQFFLQEREVQRDALTHRLKVLRSQGPNGEGGQLTMYRNRGEVEGTSNTRVNYVLEQELAQKTADIEYLREILAKAVEYGV